MSLDDVDFGRMNGGSEGGAGGAVLISVEGASNGGAGGAPLVVAIDPSLGLNGNGDGADDGAFDPGTGGTMEPDPEPEVTNLITNPSFQRDAEPWFRDWDDGTETRGNPGHYQAADNPEFIIGCVKAHSIPDVDRYIGWNDGDGVDLQPGDYTLSARVFTGPQDGQLAEFRVSISAIDEPYEAVFSTVQASPGTTDQVREYDFTVPETKSRLGIVFVAQGNHSGYLCVDDVVLFNRDDLEQ